MARKKKSAHKKIPHWANRLRELRESTGLSQEAFAKTLGLKSQQAWQAHETGREPRFPLLKKIYEVYRISPHDLIYGPIGLPSSSAAPPTLPFRGVSSLTPEEQRRYLAIHGAANELLRSSAEPETQLPEQPLARTSGPGASKKPFP